MAYKFTDEEIDLLLSEEIISLKNSLDKFAKNLADEGHERRKLVSDVFLSIGGMAKHLILPAATILLSLSAEKLFSSIWQFPLNLVTIGVNFLTAVPFLVKFGGDEGISAIAYDFINFADSIKNSKQIKKDYVVTVDKHKVFENMDKLTARRYFEAYYRQMLRKPYAEEAFSQYFTKVKKMRAEQKQLKDDEETIDSIYLNPTQVKEDKYKKQRDILNGIYNSKKLKEQKLKANAKTKKPESKELLNIEEEEELTLTKKK